MMNMTPRAAALTVGTMLSAVTLTAQSPANTSVPSDTEIRKILVERIDTERQSVGLVAGVIEPTGRRVVAYGSLAKGDSRQLNGDTIFEIGSITKVFTSLLLADAVERHEVALSDPIAKYLPPQVTVPERGGRTITLQDLSTHTSALPRLPANLSPKDPSNPHTRTIRSTSSISFSRVCSSRATSVHSTNIRTSAAVCSDTCCRDAREWITKRLFDPASPGRSE